MTRRSRWILALGLVMALLGGQVRARGDDLEPTAANADQATAKNLTLPAALPDGRLLSPIGIYESQMAELIPESYRPVSIDRLDGAVQRLMDRATDDQASRLRGGEYWVKLVGDELVSERSAFDMESDRDGIVRRAIGPVNFALDPPQNRSSVSTLDSLPRLESGPNGNLVAVFKGGNSRRTRIDFKWRLHGRVYGSGYEFMMQLPMAPQSRIVFSASPGMKVEVLDGVIRSRPGPPPDAGQWASDRDSQWYEIDAGGLSSIRIRTSQIESPVSDSMIVRRSSIQYEIDPAGLNWIQRMTVELPSGQTFPSLNIFDATLTSVKVNSSEVAFTSKRINDRTEQIQIDSPPISANAPSNSTTVTLAGQSSWTDSCRLPIGRWIGDAVIHTSAMDDVQLAVASDLEVVSWDLPNTWSPSKPQSLDGIRLWSASGPPVGMIELPAAKGLPDSSPTNSQPSWSHVRFAQRPLFRSMESWLKLEVGKGTITAKSRLTISVDPQRLEPIQLKIQKGFTLENVVFVRSQRSIESPGVNVLSQTMMLWPEPEDISPSINGGPAQWIIEATGTRPLTSAPPAVAVPPCWFVGVEGVRGRIVASIIPPADLNWSGEAAIQRDRIRLADLTPEQSAFLLGGDRPTLYFIPTLGRTPELFLEKPSVSFDVSTRLQIQRDATEIIEELNVNVESAGKTLTELTVQTGRADGLPPYRWSLGGESGLPSTSLPPSDIAIGTDDESGTYTIDVSELNLRGRPLIGRRHYVGTGRFELQLPSVPGAISQQSEVVLGDGLAIAKKSRSVQLVPVIQKNDVDQATSQKNSFQRLRYDAVEQPTIILETSDHSGSVTIVRRESVRVIASSRGTDRIEATFVLSSTAPFIIDYPPDLQLASIERDGEPVNLLSIPQQPIQLQARNKIETINVVWNRSQMGSLWIRKCRIPRIKVSGVVLKSEYQLIPASDTFAPTALFRGDRYLASTDAVEVVPGARAMLVRRNIALAVGWLVSLLMFAIAWTIAARSPLTVAVAVAVITTLTILWWPWKLAVIGWLIVPTVAGGLLATTQRWTGQGMRETPKNGRPVDPTGESSTELSWVSIIRILLIAIFASGSIGVAARAQELKSNDVESDTRRGPIGILLPIDTDGRLSGDVVYIPRSFHEDLFPSEIREQIQQPNFQSADYRVRINPVVDAFDAAKGSPDQLNRRLEPTIEGEFLIQLMQGYQNSNQVQLPIRFAAVRRVELVDETDRIVRFVADESGLLVVSLPKGDAFRIRVTMVPTVSQTEPWTKLLLSVPPVASSRLVVESEKNIEALRVGGSTGRLLPETDLRRWTTDIGPVESLEIDYRIASASKNIEAKALRRRYWINVGKLQTSIECEIDPPTTVAAGESFQFVIRDAEMPLVTSPDWRRVSTDLYSPTRRLVTMSALRDAPGPIRLLWSRPKSLDGIGEEGSAIVIPEVIAAALGENAPAWIALHCDRSLSFKPLAGEQTEPLSVDQFMAAWSGYRGLIDRALVTSGNIPAISVLRRTTANMTVTANHHLHIMPDRLELRYEATVIPGDDSAVPQRLSIPSSMELIQLSVGGVKLDSAAIRAKDSLDFLLGDFTSGDPILVVATAIQVLPKDSRFTPPRIRLSPSIEVTDTYTISRDGSTYLRVVEPVPIEPDGPAPKANAESLIQGWIPISTWSIPTSDKVAGELPKPAKGARRSVMTRNSLGGLFQVIARRTRFDCQQLVSLTRDEARWRMETRIKFDNNRIPDFIDVEVPTRWCETLDVAPTTSWSRQPATDPAQQIIRIRCDAAELGNQTIVVTGNLQSADAGRISVPAVRVLGLGRRRIHISVPNRLVNESIQWRTSAVEAVELLDAWRTTSAAKGQRSTYVAASPSWSIDLAPLPTHNADAIALTQDNRAFSQSDGVLVVSHWDLFPGGLESVLVDLPIGAECVGGWSAGQPVRVQHLTDSVPSTPTVKTNTKAPTQSVDSRRVRIPLSLSRMSQAVEILIRVPSETAKNGAYVPHLVDIPVTQNWLSVYQYDDRPPDLPQPPVTSAQQRRAVSLARSVVESVEQAVDIIAERPNEEVAVWLAPWVVRYQQLASGAGHVADFVLNDRSADAEQYAATLDIDDSPVTQSTRSESDNADAAPMASMSLDLQWQLLDERMAVYVQRYMSESSPDPISLFSVSNFDGFVATEVTQLSGSNRAPSIQTISTNDRGLRNLIMNLLTLGLVAGTLMCLKPLQRFANPILVHPAFWLGLVGLFGFAVAPASVAAAIILVAVSLPVFPKRSWNAPQKLIHEL